MKTNSERHLGFVLRYYRHGALDTRAAMRKVMLRTGGTAAAARRWRYAAAAAVILLVAGVSAVWYSHATGTVTLAAGDAVRTFTLPDSTRITLRQGSSIAYSKRNPRAVRLEGTGYFKVRHDEEHPFTVSNAISAVRVLGTEFEVESPRTASTEVYVTKGRVLFSSIDKAQGLVLTKGMKARLDNGDRKPHLITPGSVNQTAWATGMFHFMNTPLPEVLSDLTDCYGVKLSCTEHGKRLTGDIQADSLTSVIQLIEQTLDVRINVIKR